VNDAQEIAERLKCNNNFRISNSNILLNRDASRENILKAVGRIFNRKDISCDLVAFYFSGHGMIDENHVGYLAPYDMEPEDPFINGINMEDLRNFISKSKNKASAVMFLDCCYAGIATKGEKVATSTVMADQETKNIYSDQLQMIVDSPIAQTQEKHGRGNYVLASSEATATSREMNNCMHYGKQDSHTHGAFSFYLIEGLDGKAADPKTGVITVDNLRRHIELEMSKQERQIPMYRVTEGTNLESIIIAKSLARFNAKIAETIKEVRDFCSVKYKNSTLTDIQCLANAAKKVGELISLDPNNLEIEGLSNNISTAAKALFDPAIMWITENQGVARPKINEIETDLYPEGLMTLVQDLSIGHLQKIDQNTLNILIALFSQISANTKFESENDSRLTMFHALLRASIKPASRLNERNKL
jgi:Caspase domain